MDERSLTPVPIPPDAISDVLAQAERLAQEQVSRVVAERFREVEPLVRGRLEREFDSAVRTQVDQARRDATRDFSELLNRSVRRMRDYESDRHWCEAVLDAVEGYCRRAAFFSVRGEDLCFQGGRGFETGPGDPPAEVPINGAAAFLKVARSARTVFVTNPRHDLSATIADYLGEAPDGRIVLVPVATRERVPGILYIDSPSDIDAVELVAEMAGSALESELVREEGTLASRARIRPAGSSATGGDSPEHAAARRFAQVEVARMILHEYDAVRRGREASNLYDSLKPLIDRAREAFRVRRAKTEMPDYLHDELTHTLANDQPELLGPNYPGPLG